MEELDAWGSLRRVNEAFERPLRAQKLHNPLHGPLNLQRIATLGSMNATYTKLFGALGFSTGHDHLGTACIRLGLLRHVGG